MCNGILEDIPHIDTIIFTERWFINMRPTINIKQHINLFKNSTKGATIQA